MDAPRRWQVASVATAVASMSLGGLLLARPSSEAVAPIELDAVVDGRELSVASPTDAVGTGDADDPRIVTPEVPSSIAEMQAPPTPPEPPETPETTEPTSPAEADSPDDDVEDADDADETDDEADSPDEADSIDSP